MCRIFSYILAMYPEYPERPRLGTKPPPPPGLDFYLAPLTIEVAAVRSIGRRDTPLSASSESNMIRRNSGNDVQSYFLSKVIKGDGNTAGAKRV